MLPCIIVHSAINTLGTFANDADVAMQGQLIHIAVLIAITVAYTLILIKTLPKKQLANAAENKRSTVKEAKVVRNPINTFRMTKKLI